MLVDTHCHLNIPEYFSDPEASILEARAGGVDRLVLVGIDPASSAEAARLAAKHDDIFAVVGIHPNHAANFQSSWLNQLRALVGQPRVVAIGEIGLDYHWDYASPADQELALMAQLALGLEANLPVVFHCRGAYNRLLEMLEAQPYPHQMVFHCFVGDQTQADRAMALDGYFGVDGPITYKNANDLRQMVATLPRDRVVLETDSPFLSPVPYRGKANRPGHIKEICAKLAELWNVSHDEAARITTENASRLFRLS